MDYKSPLSESEKFGNNKSTAMISVPSKLDKSDKKSLDLLLQGSIFTNGKNYKQASISAYLSSPSKKVTDMKMKTKSRQKKSNEIDSSKNIGKLKRGGTSTARKSHKTSSGDNSPKLTNMTWLQKTNPKSDNKARGKKKKLISSSFTKYGMHVQSFEDILREMKDCTNYKKCLENLPPIDTSLCLPEMTENEPESKEDILDCKYMTRKEIKSAFHRHFDYLQEISSGQRYSERHDLYFRSKSCNSSELNYNTSMIVFTSEQKQILANLLYKKFGNSSLHGHYYFKVLLPEICLKIFMEEHNMSYEEASNYLKQRPVDA